MDDGNTGALRFNGPTRPAMDGAGNVIVANLINHAVRRVAPDDTETTRAGTGVKASELGLGTQATMFSPERVAAGTNGTVYMVDAGNGRIIWISRRGW